MRKVCATLLPNAADPGHPILLRTEANGQIASAGVRSSEIEHIHQSGRAG